ncbi:NUDIX domain-containing protein [Herbaspirillum sp. WKF16]|jgi:colanic acid biosynthesis protein WcaH|uniref:GDP-mannose mannosyl hydrolase n=1 Tax=Herbaspirillum sp. WKF16 TaxID=3028312 RepID=UPI0023A9A7BA|nr:NUDIX domain-containing protein [Herbaspirillum sp. WKF16]WDZ97716.1 NUDIX domain-containing protein [Herbaspirillum sp. WKF16]
MNLAPDDFALVIDSTPLVSIDLLIRNAGGEVLLGLRRNRPAQDFWFVPGGRIRKNEALGEALRRIALAELGAEPQSWELQGAYDHIYDDNALGRAGINTHYVALGCRCVLPPDSRIAPDAQHAELRWWPLEALLQDPRVHLNTKRYFQEAPANRL